jgi:hypothetical protein
MGCNFRECTTPHENRRRAIHIIIEDLGAKLMPISILSHHRGEGGTPQTKWAILKMGTQWVVGKKEKKLD